MKINKKYCKPIMEVVQLDVGNNLLAGSNFNSFVPTENQIMDDEANAPAYRSFLDTMWDE